MWNNCVFWMKCKNMPKMRCKFREETRSSWWFTKTTHTGQVWAVQGQSAMLARCFIFFLCGCFYLKVSCPCSLPPWTQTTYYIPGAEEMMTTTAVHFHQSGSSLNLPSIFIFHLAISSHRRFCLFEPFARSNSVCVDVQPGYLTLRQG